MELYSEFYAAWLKNQGIKEGDRVCIFLSNDEVRIIPLIFACSKIGAIFCILNYQFKFSSVKNILLDTKAKILLTDMDVDLNHIVKTINIIEIGPIKNKLLDFRKKTVIPNKTACLIYTSGSTGKPKGVMVSHFNILFTTESIQKVLKLNYNDRIFNTLPLAFDYGLYQIFLAFYVGATLVLYKQSDISPNLLNYLVEMKITVLPSMPNLTTAILKLLKRKKNAPCTGLRMITNTGEKLPRNTILDIKNFLPNCKLFLMYGLTECKRVSILDPQDIGKKGDSVGKPIPNTECYVIDEEGRRLPPNTIGQLVVRGFNVTQGYWNSPEQTNNKFVRVENGSWETVLLTGDLFKVDEEGYLYFIGRIDDMYKQNGVRMYPKEIENAVLSIEGIENAYLMPPNNGSKSILYVQTLLDKTEIKFKLLNLLEYYKMPDEIVVLQKFPITPNGKIDKNTLKIRRLYDI